MKLIIKKDLIIPFNELKWRFSRSSGSGGQNVNKINSRVELIFNLNSSKVFSPFQKQRIRDQLKNRIVNDCICVAVQEERTQYQNRKLALIRLALLLNHGLKSSSKIRRLTHPTRSSQRRRVDLKKKRGIIKRNRQSKSLLDD